MERLEKNIIDQIKEAQLKLGYAKETIRLYYPIPSMNALLGTQLADGAALCRMLQERYQGKLLPVKPDFTLRDGRIEVSVPPEGAEYVYRQVPSSGFLADLIALFASDPHCGRGDIFRIFEKYSTDYHCEEMAPGSDFDYVIYFEDPSIDEYYYCFREEMGHTIYHRFTKEDYRKL